MRDKVLKIMWGAGKARIEVSKLNVYKKEIKSYSVFLLLLACTNANFIALYPTLDGIDLGGKSPVGEAVLMKERGNQRKIKGACHRQLAEKEGSQKRRNGQVVTEPFQPIFECKMQHVSCLLFIDLDEAFHIAQLKCWLCKKELPVVFYITL